MTLVRGKVRKQASDAEPVRRPVKPGAPRGAVVKASVLIARSEARAILDEAKARAAALVADAELATQDIRLRAVAEGRADGLAEVAALAVAQADRDAKSDERQLDRSVALAELLAERLLGEALALAPERVTALARQALLEARGARRIKIVAHPGDAVILERSLGMLGFEPGIVSIDNDPERDRGNLRMVTDIGTLDAELAPELARLAAKLREALRHER